MLTRKKIAIFAFLISLIVFVALWVSEIQPFGYQERSLGSKDNPYKIENSDDLSWLASEVNKGKTFANKHFIQTEDIDISELRWIPIGNSKKNSFAGFYNGNGKSIQGIKVKNDKKNGIAALFGYLKGKVVNVTIDGGEITGDYAASIAAHSVGNKATIINCSNSAKVNGVYAGGIASDFADGTIASCVNTGEIIGEVASGSCAITNNVKIYRCYSTTGQIVPAGVVSTNSFAIQKDSLNSETTAAKLNMGSGIAAQMYLGREEQVLNGWNLNKGVLRVSRDGDFTINIIRILSEWTPFSAIIVFAAIRQKNAKDRNIWQHIKSTEKSTLIIWATCVLLSLFFDAYLLGKGINELTFGSAFFILAINIFAVEETLRLKKEGFRIRVDTSILALIGIVLIFELVQYRNIPRYDANIYYGSFVEACSTFQPNLISFFAVFNCWKWAQGVAIFCAPIEFLIPGEIVSVYIGNTVVSVITIILMAQTIKRIYVNIDLKSIVICCAIFLFSPYILGVFSYFDMDWNVACYTIWLIAAIVAHNNFGIVSCGLLLALTKITGLAFYVLILIAYFIFMFSDISSDKREKWVNYKTVILWTIPGFLYLSLLLYGDDLTSQSFFGTYVSDEGMIKIGNINQMVNTFLQGFIFGFRWLINLMLVVGIVRGCLNKSFKTKMTKDGWVVFRAVCASSLLTVIILMIYNSDANCPRYTAILSATNAVLFPFAIQTMFRNCNLQKVISTSIAILLFVQMFATIDPSILLYCEKIETGGLPLYKLAWKKDARAGMNLTSGPNGSVSMLGDLYTYNLQYSFYDWLLDEILPTLDIDSKTVVYSLNVGTYEINLSGKGFGTYNIYYDFKKNKRTFRNDKDTRLIDFEDLVIADGKIQWPTDEDKIPDRLYLLVPYRMWDVPIEKAFNKISLSKASEKQYSNPYGSIKVYEFEK